MSVNPCMRRPCGSLKNGMSPSSPTANFAGTSANRVGISQEAIATYVDKHKEIGLVLLDPVMPGMGGKKAFEESRKFDPAVKIVLSSGCGGARKRSKASRLPILKNSVGISWFDACYFASPIYYLLDNNQCLCNIAYNCDPL